VDYFKQIQDELSNSWVGDIPGAQVTVQKTIDSFVINITNTTGQAKKIALIPAFFNTGRPAIPAATTFLVPMNGGGSHSAGSIAPRMLYDDITEIARFEPVDAVIADGLSGVVFETTTATEQVKVSAQQFSVADFLNFIKNVPSAVKSIVVTANDQSVFESTLKVQKVSPFNSEGSYIITLNDFLNTTQLIDKKVEIDTVQKYGKALQLDNQTLLVYIMPGTVNGVANVSVSFKFNLERRFNIAEMNMAATINDLVKK